MAIIQKKLLRETEKRRGKLMDESADLIYLEMEEKIRVNWWQWRIELLYLRVNFIQQFISIANSMLEIASFILEEWIVLCMKTMVDCLKTASSTIYRFSTNKSSNWITREGIEFATRRKNANSLM